MPVVQSSAVESSSKGAKEVAELNTELVRVSMIWKFPFSRADKMRWRTGSIEMSSLVISPNRSSGAPKTLVRGFKDCSWPLEVMVPSASHARPVLASVATPHVIHEPPEKFWEPVASAVSVVRSVVPLSTYTSFELPLHTVSPVVPLLEQEFTGSVVGTTVGAPTVGSSCTTMMPLVNSDQLPSGTYAVTVAIGALPRIKTPRLDVGRQDPATSVVTQVPPVQVVPDPQTVPQEPQLFGSVF